MDHQSTHSPIIAKKNLSNEERVDIFQTLLRKSENGKLKNGELSIVASSFGVCSKTISRIWKRGLRLMVNGSTVDVSSRILGKKGRQKVEIDVSRVANIPKRRRKTIRSLAYALDMSKTTLHKRVKEGALRKHTNVVKPHLTDANKIRRLNFCLSKIHPQGNLTNPLFEDMMDVVHIDEKWFFLSKETERYYLLPGELEPYRTCKSKRFIPKIMFLAAVA